MSCERIDVLPQSGIKIIQDTEQFCFGIDAVLLADFASKEIRRNSSCIDLCSGNGIIAFLTAGAFPSSHVTALELQKDAALLAQRSVELNSLQQRITVVNDDLKNVQNLFAKYSFDDITCNPPYAKASHGKESPVDAKAIARHEICCSLEDVIKAAEYLLKPNGRFYLIHRPSRLSEIFVLLNNFKMEAKRMRLVFPEENAEPTMVMIEARKNQKPELLIEKPLYVYKSKGVYTDEVQQMYEAKNC